MASCKTTEAFSFASDVYPDRLMPVKGMVKRMSASIANAYQQIDRILPLKQFLFCQAGKQV